MASRWVDAPFPGDEVSDIIGLLGIIVFLTTVVYLNKWGIISDPIEFIELCWAILFWGLLAINIFNVVKSWF